jgi:phosphoribosylanthranilate isomerase
MLTQIYEIQNVQEALAVQEAGVDHVGFWASIKPDRRALSIELAREVVTSVRRSKASVALVLSTQHAEIVEIWAALKPTIIHIGADPALIPPASVATLKNAMPGVKLMSTIPVRSEADITLALSYDGIADYLLLDSSDAVTGNIGTTGRVHDWTLSQRIVANVRVPVILAGGLSPSNVREAIRIVAPAGVDSKTHTDISGSHQKDIALVTEFVRACSC